MLTLKSDTSLSAPFSQGCDFFGTLPYNQIDLQKYFFDASPGSAKITCENIVHTIHIRKYTLVPTLGCLKVDLSFEEKRKKNKLPGFKEVANKKATFGRFLIHKGIAAGRSVYSAALRSHGIHDKQTRSDTLHKTVDFIYKTNFEVSR